MDDRTRKRYETISDPEDRTIILEGLRYPEGQDGCEFAVREDGRCSFLREDGLCHIQRCHGEAYLTNICWQYPRVLYGFPSLVECSLAVSCPIAAGLVLTDRPLRFHQARRVIPPDRSLLQPVPEVLALGETIFELQRIGLALLQESRFSLDQRLLALCRLFARADEAAGESRRAERLAGFCREAGSSDYAAGLLATPPAGFQRERALRWCARLMGTIYEHSFSEEKTAALAAACGASYPSFCREIRQRYAPLWENYLVNDFFLRLYPFAFPGTFVRNLDVFLASWKLVETALLAVYAQNGSIDQEGLIAMVVRVASHLGHNTMSMRRIGQAVDELRSDGEAVAAFLIDSGGP